MKNKIIIDREKTLFELKSEFNELYPYLKLEFFREIDLKKDNFSKDKLITSNEKVSQLQRIKKYGSLTFSDETTVGELEQLFFKKFGLYMQVFRKSGKVWLETTSTDDWSLNQQNEEGRSLARHFKIERENPDDHDIY